MPGDYNAPVGTRRRFGKGAAMKYAVISADSHIVEPRDLWTAYMERAYKDDAPHIESIGGADTFVCRGEAMARPGGYSLAGRTQFLGQPSTYADVYPGGADPKARLKDMERDGVDAEVVYPSCAMKMYALADVLYKQACFRAYNRWAADFGKAVSSRLKAIGVMTLEDLEGAVSEVHQAKRLGLVGAMISVTPADPGKYAQQAFDPFWAAAQDLEMPISLHVVTDTANITHNLIEHTMFSSAVQRTLASMIFGGVFLRFPRLKVVSAENDAGWAAYFIQRMDYLFHKRVNYMRSSPIRDKGLLPSDYFKRNAYLTFMDDRSGIFIRELIGVERLMWSSDYPHNDSTWPDSQQVIASLFKGVPESHKRKILAENAARLYGFV